MSHVVLRHGTKQLTAQNLVQIPLVLAGALTGHSLLGQLAQIGIGLGANSVLLKFSRTDEEQADYNGTEMMADAGYNPVELGRFFEKLEKQSGARGSIEQFLSDHPDPGNRVAAIEDEIRQMPRRPYVEDRDRPVSRTSRMLFITCPSRPRVARFSPTLAPALRRYPRNGRAASYVRIAADLSRSQYPDNWQAFGRLGSPMRYHRAIRTAWCEDRPARRLIGYGLEVDYYSACKRWRRFESRYPGAHPAAEANQSGRCGSAGRPAASKSRASRHFSPPSIPDRPIAASRKWTCWLTVARPEGLFYVVFIAPQSLFDQIQPTFEDVLRSVRF